LPETDRLERELARRDRQAIRRRKMPPPIEQLAKVRVLEAAVTVSYDSSVYARDPIRWCEPTP